MSDRVVAGDFDGNGKDDLAMLYDYGAWTGMHVLLSSGSSFQWNGTSSAWNPSSVGTLLPAGCTGRLVAGNFDGDETGRDDVACLYDAGVETQFWVWRSAGGGFAGELWKTIPASIFSVGAIQHRVAAIDLDGSGRDDIATFYDYGGCDTKVHTFMSTGSTFSWNAGWWDGWWGGLSAADKAQEPGKYCAARFSRRVVGGHFNDDAYGDLGALYDLGLGIGSASMFFSTGEKLRFEGILPVSCAALP